MGTNYTRLLQRTLVGVGHPIHPAHTRPRSRTVPRGTLTHGTSITIPGKSRLTFQFTDKTRATVNTFTKVRYRLTAALGQAQILYGYCVATAHGLVVLSTTITETAALTGWATVISHPIALRACRLTVQFNAGSRALTLRYNQHTCTFCLALIGVTVAVITTDPAQLIGAKAVVPTSPLFTHIARATVCADLAFIQTIAGRTSPGVIGIAALSQTHVVTDKIRTGNELITTRPACHGKLELACRGRRVA